jgi:predicted fused transcriptional regulator/phosphomethylpyrimidine kinase
LGNLVKALHMLENCPEFASLVPEVRVNLAYALREAETAQDVAAVEGRITAVHGFPRASGMPNWGASDHLARRLLEVQKYDPEINAVINFKCNQKVIEVVQQYCSERSLLFGWLDRSEEPDYVTEQDGTSMPWKVKQVFSKYGAMPRLFYEGTGRGKEPLFLALGKDAVDVAKTAIDIAHRYGEKTIKR